MAGADLAPDPGRDPDAALTSWADGPARAAITGFVESLTLPTAERVAVFDSDGTLWCEKPMPIQLDFLVQRFIVMAAENPALAAHEPYRAAADRDFAWFDQAIVKHYHGDDGDVGVFLHAVNQAFAGVYVEDYAARVDEFFAAGQHMTLHRPYLSCAYQPMIELLRYLEAHGFATYIASGSDRDFMRPAARAMYGIPPERVIGSSAEVGYAETGGEAGVLYKDHIDFLDDGPAKPVRIWSRTGRRPTIAVGNSNGDLPMFRFAGGSGPALRILVHHDDAAREFAYTAGAEDALAEAAAKDWTIVRMAADWSRVFTG